MKTIYKYAVPPEDEYLLPLPKGATILTVQIQHGVPVLWALVNPDEPALEVVRLRIYGTGHPMDEPDLTYIGTFQMLEGAIVFHIFRDRVSWD